LLVLLVAVIIRMIIRLRWLGLVLLLPDKWDGQLVYRHAPAHLDSGGHVENEIHLLLGVLLLRQYVFGGIIGHLLVLDERRYWLSLLVRKLGRLKLDLVHGLLEPVVGIRLQRVRAGGHGLEMALAGMALAPLLEELQLSLEDFNLRAEGIEEVLSVGVPGWVLADINDQLGLLLPGVAGGGRVDGLQDPLRVGIVPSLGAR
jgi:hypothetical protein